MRITDKVVGASVGYIGPITTGAKPGDQLGMVEVNNMELFDPQARAPPELPQDA